MSHYMTPSGNTIRRRAHRRLLHQGFEAPNTRKYAWLSSEENVCDSRLPFFEELQASDLKTRCTRATKENTRSLWAQATAARAKLFSAHGRSWGIYSRVTLMAAVAEGLDGKSCPSSDEREAFTKVRTLKP